MNNKTFEITYSLIDRKDIYNLVEESNGWIFRGPDGIGATGHWRTKQEAIDSRRAISKCIVVETVKTTTVLI